MEEKEEKTSFVDRITVDDFKKMVHGTLEVKNAQNGKKNSVATKHRTPMLKRYGRRFLERGKSQHRKN